jgi:hypothetical protein
MGHFMLRAFQARIVAVLPPPERLPRTTSAISQGLPESRVNDSYSLNSVYPLRGEPAKEKLARRLPIEPGSNNILAMSRSKNMREEMVRLSPANKRLILETFSQKVCEAVYRHHGIRPPDAEKTGYYIWARRRFMRVWEGAARRGRIHKKWELHKIKKIIPNIERWMESALGKIDIPGDVIKAYRERLGYSQSAIAEAMEWSRQYQSRLEKSESVKITSRSFRKLWRHLSERDAANPPQWTGPALQDLIRDSPVTHAQFAEFAGWSRKYQAKLENTSGLLPSACQRKIQRLAHLIHLY